MTKTEVKAKVLDYIRRNDGVSYAELEHFFNEIGYNYIGEMVSCSDQSEHIVFWHGWSTEAFEIIAELKREKLIDRDPCTPLIYLVDGIIPHIPIFKGGNYKKLKRDRWLPCVFNAC